MIFAPLVNDAEHAAALADAAAGLVGEAKVDRNKPPGMASEDFSFMLEKVPGAYINLGNGEDSAPGAQPAYNFNDAAIPTASRCSPAGVNHSAGTRPAYSYRGRRAAVRCRSGEAEREGRAHARTCTCQACREDRPIGSDHAVLAEITDVVRQVLEDLDDRNRPGKPR